MSATQGTHEAPLSNADMKAQMAPSSPSRQTTTTGLTRITGSQFLLLLLLLDRREPGPQRSHWLDSTLTLLITTFNGTPSTPFARAATSTALLWWARW